MFESIAPLRCTSTILDYLSVSNDETISWTRKIFDVKRKRSMCLVLYKNPDFHSLRPKVRYLFIIFVVVSITLSRQNFRMTTSGNISAFINDSLSWQSISLFKEPGFLFNCLLRICAISVCLGGWEYVCRRIQWRIVNILNKICQ